jgi:hypothetical protein
MDPAVLAAEVDGLPAVQITISTSGAPEHHPVAVARAYRSLETFSFLGDVQA